MWFERIGRDLALVGVFVAALAGSARGEAASPFHPVITVSDEESLHVRLIGDTPLFQYDGDGVAMGTLGPRGVVLDPRWSVGIADCGLPASTTMTGRLPDAAWVVRDLQAWSACPTEDANVMHWTGQEWRMVEAFAAHDVRVAPWHRGSALAVVVPFRSGPPWGYELRLIGAPPGLEPPLPRLVQRPAGSDGSCYTELEHPIAFATAEDGSALVVGAHSCQDEVGEDDEPNPVAEYFAPGARKGRILVAPVGSADAVFVRTPRDFWIGGSHGGRRTRIAHFAGNTWTKMAGPPGTLLSISADDTDTVWALTETGTEIRRVWRKRPGHSWVRVPLPAAATPIASLIVRRGGDAWLVAGHSLYSTLPVREVLNWQRHVCTDEDQERERRERGVVNAVEPRDGARAEPCCNEAPAGMGPEF